MLVRIAAAGCLAVALSLGCAGGPSKEGPSQPPAASLLLVAPYIGDETELRNPLPEPTRMVKPDESIAGWPAPPERVLRFPVELRKGATLSFRLGAIADTPVEADDVAFRVEYSPESSNPDETRTLVVIYETTPRESMECFRLWTQVEVPLFELATGRGELRLVVDGPLAGDPEVQLFWGQPTIHYPAERRHRNVLLIGVDTLRWDAVTPFGGKADQTPNLEEFSKRGTAFPMAWSQCPWTLPSFASMLTGGLPSRIGATKLSWQLPDRAVSLAEMLLPEGFATGAVCSNVYLGNKSSGFHQGMEGLWYRYNVPPPVSVDRAKGFISRSKDRDWFCFLHFQDPHAPYDPPEHLAARFCDPNYQGPYKQSFHDDTKWKWSEIVPPEEDIKQARGLYDAESAYVDEALKDLFEFLEQTGLMNETLIVFAADHGEEFYEHGAFEHGHTHFEELVRVPLMVGGPGFPAGERVEAAVGNFDIVPTILRYLGLPIPPDLPGVPLQDVLAGNAPTDRIIFGEDNICGDQRKFAVQWPYKCILDFLTGEVRLYDLSADAEERENIGDLHREMTDRLSRAMIAAMLPDKSVFHVWFLGSPDEGLMRFTGTLKVPGGIEEVQAFELTEEDEYSIEGDTVRFSVTNRAPEARVDKHLSIVPAGEADALEMTLRVDDRIDPDRFFPYGTLDPEPSGFATVHLDDFPLVPDIPIGEQSLGGACYVWGVRGFGNEVERAELDPESLEALRALGYIH